MNRLRSLDPLRPVVRYEHKRPGDLIHFDIKRRARIVKPGHRVHGDRTRETRGAGYEYLHIAIDDHSRISLAAILPDQTHQSALLFFFMARAFTLASAFPSGACSPITAPVIAMELSAGVLRLHNIKHRFNRPYTPRTNGRTERFIQTALNEWAYARTYQNSAERTQRLDPWLHDYNFHRPHASLNFNTPASRSGLNRNNLWSLHI